MAGTLRDELASLKIDRGAGASRPARGGGGVRPARRGGGGGIGLLAVLLWLIPLSLLAAAGVVAYRQYDQLRSKPEVEVRSVELMTPGEAEKLLSAKGFLKSRHQALIGAKLPGRVERMFVEEGTRVKKGQVLAVLEHNDLKAMLASRRAMLERSRAELREARVDRKDKERKAKRAARLSLTRSVSAEEAEQTAAASDMAEARVAALEAAINLQAANVAEIEAMIRNMHLFAPFDGTVVEKQGEEGEVITPSAMSASFSRSAVVSLANLEQMDVETDVTENLISRVAIGQPAEVSVSAVPDKHYRGRLRQIIPMGDHVRGTVKVKVEILDPDQRLFPELVATVHFLPDKSLNNPGASQSYLYIPKDAVVEENGHSHVWVVDVDRSSVRKRRVEVAVTNDELARVESGLKSGERVVLKPPKSLRENEIVKVVER
jgi:RND family efflux transporter MFP subunit